MSSKAVKKNEEISPVRPPRSYLLFAAIIFLSFMMFSRSMHPPKSDEPFKLRLYTNNVRYDNKDLVPGEEPWSKRNPYVSKSIVENTKSGSSVVCLQELLHNQLEDILAYLNSHDEWAYFGVGRADGKQEGEYSPILYKVSEWSLISSRTYWLSETPDKPSVGWDAALERIVTEVVLQSKHSEQRVKVLNTHFDHIGVQARRESIKLIISKMDLGNEPSFLCGDFNTQPTDEPYAILSKSVYKDSRTQVHNPDEEEPTFTGFNTEGKSIIDYIWADPKSQWLDYHVLESFFGFYMSDHRPVVADYIL